MNDVAAAFTPADAEGFRVWTDTDPGRFHAVFGAIRCRAEGDQVRVRVATGRGTSNVLDGVHGGFILAFVDQAMFCGPLLAGRLDIGRSVTVAASTQFMQPGRTDEPLDALVEIVGETGRMLFVRGLIVQRERRVASFEGTLRKFGAPRAA